MWLRNRRFQKLGGGRLERIGIGLVSGVELLALGGHKGKETVRLIRRIRKERRWLLTAFEAFLVHSIAKAQSKRPGQMAEVGVYEGGSARMLCEAKGNAILHLFDTFEGMPESTDADRSVHRKKQYTCSFDSVQGYLAGYENVFLHKGRFPDTAAEIEDAQFSFAHFDVDLYQSTLDCLTYFYPRMIPGGIVLSHDYSILSGVRKAVDEFFADRPEEVIDLPTTQCMIVKL